MNLVGNLHSKSSYVRCRRNIGVVIATRSRPQELALVLTALQGQTVKPVAVVVCDSSDEPIAAAVRQVVAKADLPIVYLWQEAASSATQRNTAIVYLKTNYSVDYIQILDDDTIPDTCHFETLSEYLDGESKCIGVSGVTIPRWQTPRARPVIDALLHWAGLQSNLFGSVTSTGIGVPIDSQATDPQVVQWLFACSMWRSWIFDEHVFRSDLVGYAILEDVEFSTRVSHLGRLVVLPHATLRETGHAKAPIDHFTRSYRFARNRRLVMRNLTSENKSMRYVVSLVLLGLRELRYGPEGLRGIVGMWLALIDDLLGRKHR